MSLTHRIRALAPLILTSLAVGCLTTVQTRLDERDDISRYRSWSWLPHAEQTIDAPHRSDARGLDERLGRLIEQSLYRNGFVRVDRGTGRTELYVSYQVALKRRKTIVDVPMGLNLVNSYSHSASYWVEGVNREVRIYDELHLAIGIADPSGRVLWHGSFIQPLADEEPIPAGRAVETLMRDLPVSLPDES